MTTRTDQMAAASGSAPRWRGDRGAATVEQLGVVVVVALLVVAGTLGFASYGPKLSSQLCDLANEMGLSAGACENASPDSPEAQGPDHEDFRPPVCTLQTNSEQYSAEVKIAFIKFGENSGFVISENSDGTVSVTVTDGGGLGVEGGFGANVGGKDAEGFTLGANVNFGGGLTYSVGDTWNFDSMDQWEAMEQQLNDYLIDQMILQQPNGAFSFLFRDITEAPKSPTVTTATFGIEGSVSAQAGLRIQDGTKNGKPKWYSPNLGIYGSGTLSGDVTMTTNHDTNETSETFTFTASGEIGANAGAVNPGLEGEYKDAYKVTRNAEGEITKIEFMRETSGGSGGELDLDSGAFNASDNGGSVSVGGKEKQVTVTTTELAVTDDNRDIVDDWVLSNVNAAANGEPAYYPGNAYEPTQPIEGDPLATLLYEEALSSVRVYDNVESGWSFGAEFALGLKFGASFGSSESESTISDAYFLGAPGPDGDRGYIPDETCTR